MSGSTPAVRLRPLRPEDVDALVAWGEDPEFCAAAEWRVRDAASHRAFWERQLAEPPVELVRLAAEHDGALVGYADLHGADLRGADIHSADLHGADIDGSRPARRELGFLVGGPHQRRGLGTAIARAAIDHGFRELGLAMIWAEAWEANAASMRILERLMAPTGPGDAGTYRGVATRYARFEVDRATWAARTA